MKSSYNTLSSLGLYSWGALIATFPTQAMRCTALATLIFFAWMTLEPWNLAHAQATPLGRGSVAEKPKQRSKRAAEKFEQALRTLKQKSGKLDQQSFEGKESDAELDSVEGINQTIETLDVEIQAEFQAIEDKIKAAGLPEEIVKRHRQAVASYKTNCEELLKNLQSLKQLRRELKQARDKTGAATKHQELKQKIRDLKTYLADKVKESPHTPLDPNNLPHRAAKPNKRAPRLKKEEFTELQKPIQVAFNGDLSSLQLVQANPNLPTPEDLAETVEVQFTQEIRALATQLENNPVKIYEYVRNSFDFEPTYGSIKGANETLLEKSGNAMDLASLLIALLRVSGIPARYVMGTVEVPIARVMNWVGVEDAATAGDVLASGNIPVVLVTQNDAITHARFEHTWVSAYVDYVPSRGAVHNVGDTWVEVDPAFKQFIRTPGIDLNQAPPFNAQQLVNEILSTGTVNQNEGFATGFDQALFQQRLDERRHAVEEFFKAQHPDATVGEVLGTDTILIQKLGLLPASLPYRVLIKGQGLQEVPDALRHKVRFQILSLLGIPEMDKGENLATLAGKRITLSYRPATDTDRAAIAANADQGVLPAYLINVVPVLTVDGVNVVSGGPVSLGKTQVFQMVFSQPFASIEIIQNTLVAGSYRSIGLNLQTISKGLLEKLQTEAVHVKNEVDANRIVSADETVGMLLQSIIIGYLVETDVISTVISRLMRVVSFKPTVAVGTASVDVAINTLFGLPLSIRIAGSISLDVDRYVTTSFATNGDSGISRRFTQLSGFAGSELEASVLSQLTGANGPSPVSTMVVIRTANQQSIPIFHIDKNNVTQRVSGLEITQAVKQDIINSVNAGKEVTIPQQEVTVGTWRGIGYIVADPETGGAAYLISGGLAGGNSIWNFLALQQTEWLAIILENLPSSKEFMSGPLSRLIALSGLVFSVHDILTDPNINLEAKFLLTFFAISFFIISLILGLEFGGTVLFVFVIGPIASLVFHVFIEVFKSLFKQASLDLVDRSIMYAAETLRENIFTSANNRHLKLGWGFY